MELALELDLTAQKSINELMSHYNAKNRAEIVQKALAVLKVAAHVEQTEGELFARKGGQETKIIIR